MSAVLAEISTRARAAGRSSLFEHEVYALLEEAGIATPAHLFIPAGEPLSPEALDAIPSSEVVLKIVSADVTHKSDVGGVRFLARESDAVAAAIAEMLDTVARAAPEAEIAGTLIAERIDYETDLPGSEYLLSCRWDDAFGPVVVFGIGGLLTEWYADVTEGGAQTIASASDDALDRAIQTIARSPLGVLALEPGRLHRDPPAQMETLSRALHAVSKLARLCHQGSCIAELEINPLAARRGQLVAVDGFARLGTPPAHDRAPRPLATIAGLLHPRSACVLGASTRGANAGRIILQNLKSAPGLDYGHLYAIHGKAERIDGIPCHASIAELPERVDLAVVALPADAAVEAIAELVRADKARAIILITGGFAETGQTGRAQAVRDTMREARARDDGGAVLVGGNCLGIVSKREYNTFFLPSYKLPLSDAPGSNLAVISQSGAYLVSLSSNLDSIVHPRASISYGNEMDLTASDFFEYYLDHEPDLRVFGFYIEGFAPAEGERFVRLTRRATEEGKAVVVYKAGRTEFGARAAASHTASMVGNYDVARALLEDAGALVTRTLNRFEDFTKILTMLDRRIPRGKRVAVVTNAGFEAGAVSDHLYDLELAELQDETIARLRDVLPEIAHAGNPVDTTPMADSEVFSACVEIVATDPGVDMLIASAVPATPALDILAPDLSGAHPENVFAMNSVPARLFRTFQSIDKPMVCAVDSGRLYDPSVLLLQRNGIPVYRKIDRASRALAAFRHVQQLRGHQALSGSNPSKVRVLPL